MNYETLSYASDVKSKPQMVPQRHLSKQQEAIPIRATRANEFYSSGSSAYELNTHVSSGQGPAWGPKATIMGHTMSVCSWVLLLIVLIVLAYYGYKYTMKKSAGYYYF